MHFSLLIKNLEKVWGTPLKKMEKTIIIQIQLKLTEGWMKDPVLTNQTLLALQ